MFIALAVIALAVLSTRKPRRDVQVVIMEPGTPNIEANWFPTADGLRSEMWH
jgi:hypothetical protein